MWLRPVLPLACALAAAIIAAAPAHAQGGGSLAVLRAADLGFGGVAVGTTRQVRPADPQAAKFEITGRGRRTVTVRVAVPSVLSSGASTVAINFGPSSGAWSDVDQPVSATSFDPNQGFSAALPPNSPLHVWIGGTVSPMPGQPAGTYTGTITLSVMIN